MINIEKTAVMKISRNQNDDRNINLSGINSQKLEKNYISRNSDKFK